MDASVRSIAPFSAAFSAAVNEPWPVPARVWMRAKNPGARTALR